MIRSTFRNLMLVVLLACFGLSFYLFRWSQDYQTDIAGSQNDITRLNQELENARSLDVALTELDNLTITEQTATQLDILRHLGLEQSELNFQMESRDVQSIGATSLYIHNVRISGAMSYEAALALSDRLQNTKKIVINSIEIITPASGTNDVTMNLSGRIYGLDKVSQVNAPATAPVPAAENVSGTSVSATVPVSASMPVSGSLPVSGTTPSATIPAPTSPTVIPTGTGAGTVVSTSVTVTHTVTTVTSSTTVVPITPVVPVKTSAISTSPTEAHR